MSIHDAVFTPRKGDRIRWRRERNTGWSVGTYDERSECYHFVFSGFVRLPVPLDTQFEPAPEDQKPAPKYTFDTSRSVGDDTFGRITIGGPSAPDFRVKPREAILREIESGVQAGIAKFREAIIDHIESDMKAALVVPLGAELNERTTPPRPPRAEREAARKAMALEVLSGPWAGRSERK